MAFSDDTLIPITAIHETNNKGLFSTDQSSPLLILIPSFIQTLDDITTASPPHITVPSFSILNDIQCQQLADALQDDKSVFCLLSHLENDSLFHSWTCLSGKHAPWFHSMDCNNKRTSLMISLSNSTHSNKKSPISDNNFKTQKATTDLIQQLVHVDIDIPNPQVQFCDSLSITLSAKLADLQSLLDIQLVSTETEQPTTTHFTIDGIRPRIAGLNALDNLNCVPVRLVLPQICLCPASNVSIPSLLRPVDDNQASFPSRVSIEPSTGDLDKQRCASPSTQCGSVDHVPRSR